MHSGTVEVGRCSLADGLCKCCAKCCTIYYRYTKEEVVVFIYYTTQRRDSIIYLFDDFFFVFISSMTSDLPQSKARRLIGICSLVRTTIDRDQRFQLRRSKFAQRENMESSTTTTTTTPSEITLEHGLSNVGKSDAPKHFRHKAYRDGKPRPLLRGWLHAFVSCVLVLAILASIVSPVFRTILGATWYEQLSFLAGKLLSYGASAYYHIVDFKSLAWSHQPCGAYALCAPPLTPLEPALE